jgi:site-specific recombinase XerD
MAYRILRAAPLPDTPPPELREKFTDNQWSTIKWSDIQSSAPPSDFHLIVTDKGDFFEPGYLWLREKFIKNKSTKTVGNTQKAYCNDIYELLMYLNVISLRWDLVTENDLSTYVDKLIALPSTRGLPYASTTIRRRMSTIIQFYEWAAKNNLLAHPIEDIAARVSETIQRPRDSDALAHIHSGTTEINRSFLLPRIYQQLPNDCIPTEDLRAVIGFVGGNPDDPNDQRPSRNRLATELSYATGMRIDEVLSFSLNQFYTLKLDTAHRSYPLRLSKTKGLVPRNVYIPEALYAEFWKYVDNERKDAAEMCRSAPSSAFFLTHADSNRNPGSALSARSLSHAFREAVLAAGLFTTYVDLDGIERTIATHTFHDLRHTFAIGMYHLLKKNGNPNPWLEVKLLLGHKHLKTTTDTYLRSASAPDADVSDALSAALNSLRKK